CSGAQCTSTSPPATSTATGWAPRQARTPGIDLPGRRPGLQRGDRVMNVLRPSRISGSLRRVLGTLCTAVLCAGAASTALADETCMSPYMAKIAGQEDFVYVWTLGTPGVGDEQDKLVTIDVNPKSPNYGKVVASLSVGGRNEAHHSGFT